MNKSNNIQGSLLLERNDEAEKNFNYKKIYDLSKIDMLKDLNSEKKNILLKTIKKILLCTNKYIIEYDRKEMRTFIFGSIIYFIIYILIISPMIHYFFLTDEESQELENFSISQKLFYFCIYRGTGLLYRYFYSNYRQEVLLNMFLYFATNELNKIKKYFVIFINPNFDLFIIDSNSNNKNFFKKEEEMEEDNFYQYVICFPNERIPQWDTNILSEKEKEIFNQVLNGVRNIENDIKLKSAFILIGCLVLNLCPLYFLTIGNKRKFYIYHLISFVITRLGSIIIFVRRKTKLIVNEQIPNKDYIPQGYFVSFNTCMIEIFKLNSQYENISGENEIKEAYKELSKKVNDINSKFNFENELFSKYFKFND